MGVGNLFLPLTPNENSKACINSHYFPKLQYFIIIIPLVLIAVKVKLSTRDANHPDLQVLNASGIALRSWIEI